MAERRTSTNEAAGCPDDDADQSSDAVPARSQIGQASHRVILPLQARRHPLVTAVADALQHRIDLTQQSHVSSARPLVVAAVSGGADSLALLIALTIISLRSRSSDRHVAEPIACCVHHHLRPEADTEVAHVRAVCSTLNIALDVRDVYPAQSPAGSSAAAARRLRYEALHASALAHDASFIATAHHAEDQAETLLMALARGAGFDGMRGMRWQRALRADDAAGVQLIRPMLAVRKADCQSLCAAANIRWKHDPSNDLTEPARTRLRHEVMPILEALWPGAVDRMAGSTALLSFAAELLNERLDAIFGPVSCSHWPRAALQQQPLPLLAAGLRRAALHAQPTVADALGQRQLHEVAEAIAGHHEHLKRFDWPGGLVLQVAADAVSLHGSA